MVSAMKLMQQFLESLNGRTGGWENMFDSRVEWELPYAESIGAPSRVVGGDHVINAIKEALALLQDFEISHIKQYAMANPNETIAEFVEQAKVKTTRRSYRRNYVLFLRASNGKIVFMREYFDPTPVAWAFDIPLVYEQAAEKFIS